MDYKRFYDFYKVDFTGSTSNQFTGTCPFCDKEKHFYLSASTGMYQCKRCGKEGNHLTFITDLHAKYLETTEKEQYETLAKARGLTAEVLALAQFAYNPLHELWYVPYRNGSDYLNNLGTFRPSAKLEKQRYRIFKAPEIPLKLYRPFHPKSLEEEVWICEGEWDALAAYAAHRATKTASPSILAVPGANTWKDDWNKLLEGRTAVFFFDNDEAGNAGKLSIRKKASGFTFAFANWDAPLVTSLQEKCGATHSPCKDVRDIYKAVKPKTKCLEILLEMATNADVAEELTSDETVRTGYKTNIEDIPPVRDHAEFRKRITDCIYTNNSILRTIDTVLACAISVYLPGEPLWCLVVGPPSCGKSMIIEAFGGSNKYFDYVSKFTAESLVSGWKAGGDNSLLPLLNQKTLFVKDLTVILGLPEGVQQKLWDILRDSYDGYVKITFGNGEVKEYTGFKFCLVAGVTHAIHRHNDATMGERFIKIDYLGSDFDEDAHMDMAMSMMDDKVENKAKLMHTVLGYYRHLAENFSIDKLPKMNDDMRERVKALARLVANLRTKVEKDRYEGMIHRPVPEVATRLALQFTLTLRCLAYVRGETEISNESYAIVRKIAFDTCHELNFEVIDYIYRKKSVTKQKLVEDLRIPSTRVHQITSDFVQLGILNYRKEKETVMGRPTHQFYINEDIQAWLDMVRPESPKKSLALRSIPQEPLPMPKRTKPNSKSKLNSKSDKPKRTSPLIGKNRKKHV